MYNRRFNRREIGKNHTYIDTYGNNSVIVNHQVEGYIKCKLAHTSYGSTIIPDQLYFDVKKDMSFKWIQPLAFCPSLIQFADEYTYASLTVDISCMQTVFINFLKKDYVRSYKDGSELYKCIIKSKVPIEQYYTGLGYFEENMTPYLELYHHTNETNLEKIKECSYFYPSKWNIGGTKKLENRGFLYITPLEEIKFEEDLVQIAMSQKGSIHLMDNYRRIRRINIYRRNVKGLGANLKLQINAEVIAPSPLYKRRGSNGRVFYLIVVPFNLRVGSLPNEYIKFENNKISKINVDYDYLILGDCDKLSGLEAPYSEENTSHKFKIEKIAKEKNLFDFWLENANTDQYTDKEVTDLVFK